MRLVRQGGVYFVRRPPTHAEFVYDQKDRLLVIDSIMHGFPLNAMYWIVRDDGGYEVMDGQQRTISICQYFNNDFSYEERYFGRLDGAEDARQSKFLDYELTVYFCSGDDEEKIKWFERPREDSERTGLGLLVRQVRESQA